MDFEWSARPEKAIQTRQSRRASASIGSAALSVSTSLLPLVSKARVARDSTERRVYWSEASRIASLPRK